MEQATKTAYETIVLALDWFNRFGAHAPIVFGGEGELHDRLNEARKQLEDCYPELVQPSQLK